MKNNIILFCILQTVTDPKTFKMQDWLTTISIIGKTINVMTATVISCQCRLVSTNKSASNKQKPLINGRPSCLLNTSHTTASRNVQGWKAKSWH